VNGAILNSRYTTGIITQSGLKEKAVRKRPTQRRNPMANAIMHMDVLCAEDIDTLRVVFDQFCDAHQRARSDSDMETCANIMIRLYQSGERDPAVLTTVCEDALRRDIAIGA
jgi:hypothetical protein